MLPQQALRRRATPAVRAAGKDDATEHNDDDAQPGAATDVFLQEHAGNDGGRDEFEVQEQRHRSGGSSVEREHEEDGRKTAAKCDSDHEG